MNPFPKMEKWPWMLVAFVLTLLVLAKPLHTVTDVIILHKFNDYTYELAYEHGMEAGTPWVQTICKDYAPPSEAEGFAAGMILDKLNFIDTGTCWSLNPDNQASWFNRKDKNGKFMVVTSLKGQ